MAKIEIVHQSKDESQPASCETIEVRPWGLGGKPGQPFYIGSGLNFSAVGNIWLEIGYFVNGAPLFYTRNFLHDFPFSRPSKASRLKALKKFASGKQDSFGFGDMLPETSLLLKRTKFDYEGETHSTYSLEISADIGAVFGESSPGERMLAIQLKDISLEEGVRFMRELVAELEEVYQGRHPDPSALSAGTGEWFFARQLNRQAYDLISQDYREDYFSSPGVTRAFSGWLKKLPRGGHVLDAGCGHGDPVITRLLAEGFRVTGIDLSPEMLRQAQARFPGVQFFNLPVTALDAEAEYDGACSLSSLLYLDPIDLFTGIYRLYRALKPGGTLLLYAYDTHPSWRGLPYGVDIHQWMWSWTYSLDEAVRALEEHGYFKVIQAQDVTTKEQRQRSAERWRQHRQEEYDRQVRDLAPGNPPPPPPDPSEAPPPLAYCYTILARRSERR